MASRPPGGADDEPWVDLDDLRVLLGRGSKRGEKVAPSWAYTVSTKQGFPLPELQHPPAPWTPRIRVWKRPEVYRWLDVNRPGWRDRAAPH